MNNENSHTLNTLLKTLSFIAIIILFIQPLIAILSPEVLLPENMQADGIKHPKAPSIELLRWSTVLSFIPNLILIYGLWNLIYYLKTSLLPEVQLKSNNLRILGISLIAYSIALIFVSVLGSILISWDLPEGERFISLNIGTPEVSYIFIGFLLIYISKVNITRS